jgi:isopentenyldiphosphate isomerase
MYTTEKCAMTHSAERKDEMLQCFDELGNPTEARWWCGVATVWLVNDAGEVMVSRRSDRVAANPNMWQSCFGGHVGAGRSFLETVRIELAEEAGLEFSPKAFHYLATVRNEEKKVHSVRCVARFNGSPEDLRFVDHEVSEARWMSMEEQWKRRQEQPDVWCNGCPPEFQEKIQMWLQKVTATL